MRKINRPDQWRRVDTSTWDMLWAVFLGSDQPSRLDVRRILVSDTYQPDSFTVAERLVGPPWLDPDERDGEAWLRSLVARRMPGWDNAAIRGTHDVIGHVVGETSRVLNYQLDGECVADVLWNQEAPYLVDRIIGWCLQGDATIMNDDVAGDFNQHGQVFTTQFLGRFAHLLDRLDTTALARVAVAAGLVGLDRKGGSFRCTPILLPGPVPDTNLGEVWHRLLPYTEVTPAVDHLDVLLDRLSTGRAHVVWWLDDLIETAFDLFLIQRLTTANPRLRVTVVPKNGRHDNDACTTDVMRLLRLPAFTALRTAVACAQVVVSGRGPRMATANPVKLHHSLIEAISRCDLMVCKGGRVHEMFSGNVAAPMFTAYVAVRPFTEMQTGVDSTEAPLIVVGAETGEWSWWGFQGRAERRLRLPSGRPVSVCHTTVVEHDRRAHTTDPVDLVGDLVRLVGLWPTATARYGRAARAEIKLVHDRLASTQSPPIVIGVSRPQPGTRHHHDWSQRPCWPNRLTPSRSSPNWSPRSTGGSPVTTGPSSGCLDSPRSPASWPQR